MPLMPFKGIQTVTGSAQPIFGTALTAAVTPQPDPFAGNLAPGSNQTQAQVTIGSTAGFIPGQEILIGAAADFEPGLATTLADRGVIKKIVSSTVLLVQGLRNAHASGEWLLLNEVVGFIRLTNLGTHTLYLGNASTVSPTDSSVIDAIPASAATYTISIGTTQPLQTSEFWLYGTADDTFVASFGQV